VLRCEIPLPYAEALSVAEGKMRRIAEGVTEKGGVIGHIKSFITAQGERCMISITDIEQDPHRTLLAGDSASCELVVIVFLVEEELLREIIREAFEDLIG
jgi:uncharacterized protein with ACT and thioredoxin-like domain